MSTGNSHHSEANADACLETRQAIVHSVDLDARHSRHAEGIIKGFRQGIYTKNVIFHTRNVKNWIEDEIQRRGLSTLGDQTFLSHILLDMPNAEYVIARAASALRPDGCLVVFKPSITQIMTIFERIEHDHLPLIMDRVIEVGHAMTGGREWDVRTVVPRAEQRLQKSKGPRNEDSPNSFEGNEFKWPGSSDTTAPAPAPAFRMVCRPKVGVLTRGGGFVGIWRKMRNRV